MGIILSNTQGQLLWAKRIGQDAWQFPQGGIREDETPEKALFRELEEEIGLEERHVEILGRTQGWMHYDLPERFIRHGTQPLCIGQKQVWYLLKLIGNDDDVQLDCGDRPEFDGWSWVDYWHPMKEVVSFKQDVYQRALEELASLMASSEKDQPHSVHS